jgi:hypothetical protein
MPGTRYGLIAADDGTVGVQPRPEPGDDLRAAAGAAEYLVLAPSAWLDQAERLAAHRRGQGLSTRVVPLEAIYEQFGGGHAEPQAIRAFVRHAVQHWPDGQPSYVVLFGDGHYDPHHYLGQPQPNPLPALFTETAFVGEVPSDTSLVSLDDRQSLPSVMVGRLPVASADEATRLVDKLIAYDAAEGDWLQDSLAVHDDDDPLFDGMTDTATHLLSSRRWQRFGVEAALAMRQRLFAGVGYTLYVGHGSDWGWATENIFSGDDLANWPANGRAGVVMAANCLNAYFASPLFRGLGEAMLTMPGAGATAFIGWTGYTLPTNQSRMLRDFHQHLAAGADLGTALTLTQLQAFLRHDPLWADEVAGSILLGDPAMRLR